MSFRQTLRNFVGGGGPHPLLRRFLEEGIWPRGGVNRYVSHGIPKDVLENLRPEIRSLKDWERVFTDAARRYRAMGEKQISVGDPSLSSRYFLVAASCAFHAQLLPLENERSVAEMRHFCRAAFRQATDHLQPRLQTIQFPFDRQRSLGYYRCAPQDPQGTVILLNSQQSCKEDMYYFTQPLLDTGLNAVLLDIPGTGEALPDCPYRGPEEILESLDVTLPDLPGATGVPTLLFGVGVGAAVALQMAAKAPERFAAAALLSPPYDLQAEHSKLKPWVSEELAGCLGCLPADLEKELRRFRCAGLHKRIKIPVLIVGAARDRDFPHKQARKLAREFGKSRAEYWGFGHATHGAHEKQPQLRVRLAQWLGKQVGASMARDDYLDDFTDQYDDD